MLNINTKAIVGVGAARAKMWDKWDWWEG